MGETPSNRRRKGRNAFDPNCHPEELNPYLPMCSIFDQIHSDDWMDGWREAEKEYQKQLEGDSMKPTVKLIGEDGNVFNIIGRVLKALRENGLHDEAKELTDRVIRAGNYDEALVICMEYVEVE